MKSFFVCGLFILTLSVSAADLLRLGRETEIPGAGLKLRTFRDTSAMPFPMPETVTLSRSDGTKLEAVSVRDSWIYSQVEGYFAGPELTVTIYRPATPPPVSFKPLYEDYHTEQAIHEWLNTQKTDFRDASARAAWLEYLTGEKIGETSGFATKLSAPDGASDYLAVIPPGEDTPWLVVTVRVSNNAEGKRTATMLKKLAASFKTFPPYESEAKKRLPGTGPQSNVYRKSRAKIIDSIKSLKDWWYLETNHFIIVSNIKRRKDIVLLQNEAEKIRSLFERVMPASKPIESVSVIRVFDDKKEYLAYLGGDLQWTAGIWIPSRKELVFYIDSESMKKKRAEQTRRVLYHELFHQYCFYAGNGGEAAPWFNEGLAQLFEEVEFKGGRAELRLDKSFGEKAKKILSTQACKLETIVHQTYPEFQKNYRTSYDASKAFMYFLLKGAPLSMETENYAQVAIRYFQAYTETGRADAADHSAWNGIDRVSLEKAFHGFWTDRMFSKSLNDVSVPDFRKLKKDATPENGPEPESEP